MPSISIIIPNYNGLQFLKICLGSLKNQTFKDFEVIMIDDGSTDDSIKFTKENYPRVKIIMLKENHGFAYAVNQGIKRAEGKYLAILNNDTEADSNWLEELHKAFQENPNIDFCASKILSFHDRTRIDSAGDGYNKFALPYKIGMRKIDGPPFSFPKEIFGASAAASIYKKKLFEDIGYFDEDFVYYNEDSDINFRAQLLGHRCLYVPTAIVYHVLLGTSRRNFKRVVYHVCRNKINIIVKNWPSSLIWKYIIFLFLGRLRDLLMAASKGLFWSGLKGELAALAQLKIMLKKREKIQKNKKVSNEYLERFFLS